jgi:hypothetical protein
VQDVFTHMGYFFNIIADPEVEQPDNPSGKAEVLNDLSVRERANWSADQTLEYYEEQARAGLEALEALQTPAMAGATLELADLGEYPVSMLADAVVFDHLVHLTSDVLAPHGPIERPPVAMGPDRIGPTLEWMLAGLPQMCGEEVASVLEEPVALVLTGEGARTVVLSRAGDRVVVEDLPDGAPMPADRAESTASSFLRWGTTREAWTSSVRIHGDTRAVGRVLDAIDIV